ncbi:MAG: cyclodeaminase/cyclohydrolase family protein [Lachnospiraceae bacterium]|nr:cyclodeaminase/cyclohydrolase family protein [Lachnospiraceae bacterium]
MTKPSNIEEFLTSLSSKSPIPGGGGACALGGAIGSSLGSMVGNLTLGKKKYAAVQEDIQILLEKLSQNTAELLSLIEKDAAAFEPLSKAYALPKETEEEKAYKEQIMEQSLYQASLVPLEIMEKAYAGILLQEEMAEKGTRIAISDVAVGVMFLRSALLGGAVNVWINTKSMKDRETAEKLNRRTEELKQAGVQKADAIFEQIAQQIQG